METVRNSSLYKWCSKRSKKCLKQKNLHIVSDAHFTKYKGFFPDKKKLVADLLRILSMGILGGFYNNQPTSIRHKRVVILMNLYLLICPIFLILFLDCEDVSFKCNKPNCKISVYKQRCRKACSLCNSKVPNKCRGLKDYNDSRCAAEASDEKSCKNSDFRSKCQMSCCLRSLFRRH